jgi:hypothetical protein
LDSGQNYGFENETGERWKKEKTPIKRIFFIAAGKKNAREGPSRFDGR